MHHTLRLRGRERAENLLKRAQFGLARITRIAGAKRDAFFVLGDALTAVIACTVASALGGNSSLSSTTLLGGLVTAAFIIAANVTLRNYRLAWVTFSLSDLRRLFAACVLVAATHAGLRAIPAWTGLVPAGPVLTGMVLFLCLATFRGSKRLLVEPFFAPAEGRRTLIVMSSRHAYFLPNVLRRLGNFDYNIVGIIDPNPAQVGSYEQGIEVVGTTDDIEAIVERYRAEVVMVMLADDPGFGLGDFYARLHRLGTVDVKTLPSLVDIIEDRSDLGALEKLCIHELTGRPPVSTDVVAMRRVFGSKRIMVTGAGGSIGSELCRQLARFGPESIIMFERDDSNLFYIDRELRAAHPRLKVIPFLGDITRPEDTELACGRHRPQVIFHAAAYKHVPILEFHPEDAVRVHPADGGDLVAGDRLLVRDDREGLEGRPREPGLAGREHEPLDDRRDVRVRREPPSARHVAEHEARPPLLVLPGQGVAELLRPPPIDVEGLRQHRGGDRLVRHEQKRLDGAREVAVGGTFVGSTLDVHATSTPTKVLTARAPPPRVHALGDRTLCQGRTSSSPSHLDLPERLRLRKLNLPLTV